MFHLKNKNMKTEVNTTKTVVPANEVLGTKEKHLYYLIIGTGDDKVIINVGEKTHDGIANMIEKVSKKPF